MNSVLCRFAAASVLGALFMFPASAMEVGRGDFAFVSELVAKGFEPFPASSVANSIFGMKKGSDMYLCFIADTKPRQKERQETLLAYLGRSSSERDLPNIQVACVLIQ